MLTNITNPIIAITADSKNRHEDAGRGELCVERPQKKTYFNTLGESGRVTGGRVETLYFSFTACVRNARSRLRRAWPSASSSTGGGRGARARTPVCGDHMGSFSGDRAGSFCGDRIGSVFGDHMGSVSGDRVGHLICYTEMRSTR
jgi:hypothetical protein